MALWHRAHWDKCFIQLQFPVWTLFHCWKANRGFQLSPYRRSPENDHVQNYSLWGSTRPFVMILMSSTSWRLCTQKSELTVKTKLYWWIRCKKKDVRVEKGEKVGEKVWRSSHHYNFTLHHAARKGWQMCVQWKCAWGHACPPRLPQLTLGLPCKVITSEWKRRCFCEDSQGYIMADQHHQVISSLTCDLRRSLKSISNIPFQQCVVVLSFNI